MAAAKAVGDLKPVLGFRPPMCHVWLSHPLAHAICATLCGFKPQWERDVVVHARGDGLVRHRRGSSEAASELSSSVLGG